MLISIIRTVILFAVLMFAMRIMGKRQLAQLGPSELVIAVLISDLAAHPLQDIGTPLAYGLVPALTLVCCEIFISACHGPKHACPSVFMRQALHFNQQRKNHSAGNEKEPLHPG